MQSVDRPSSFVLGPWFVRFLCPWSIHVASHQSLKDQGRNSDEGLRTKDRSSNASWIRFDERLVEQERRSVRPVHSRDGSSTVKRSRPLVQIVEKDAGPPRASRPERSQHLVIEKRLA